jgi:hypothetical protein
MRWSHRPAILAQECGFHSETSPLHLRWALQYGSLLPRSILQQQAKRSDATRPCSRGDRRALWTFFNAVATSLLEARCTGLRARDRQPELAFQPEACAALFLRSFSAAQETAGSVCGGGVQAERLRCRALGEFQRPATTPPKYQIALGAVRRLAPTGEASAFACEAAIIRR